MLAGECFLFDDKSIELGDPETTEVVTTNLRERLKALLRTKRTTEVVTTN
ncbi:MAG: hypothetical protein ACRC8Y_00885 [Chroococcales cyanobacterium]